MKTIGLFMIAVSFILFALIKLDTYRKRLGALQNAIMLSQCLKRELSTLPAALPDMLKNVAKGSAAKTSLMFEKISNDMNFLGEKNFQEIWQENMDSFFPELTGNELYELKKLGAYLGACPVDMQISYISFCENYFVEIHCRENSEFPQLIKLHLGLSAALSAAIIIVFI